MKSLFRITMLLLGATLPACIEDDLDKCPPEGGPLEVNVRIEKFLARPPHGADDLEPSFAARVHKLRYLLYRDEALVEEGAVPETDLPDAEAFVFRHALLPMGAYRLALVANTAPEWMEGDPGAPESRWIVYQGEGAGDDHLRAVLPFEITCPCRNTFDAVLRRVHGLVRFGFEGLPEEVSSVEVILGNVGARTSLAGATDRGRDAARRVLVGQLGPLPGHDAVEPGAGAMTMHTFPTPDGERSTWRLRLYGADPAQPFYDRVVTDTLRIEANQLLELRTRFTPAGADFTVVIDPAWDGSIDGGNGEIPL